MLKNSVSNVFFVHYKCRFVQLFIVCAVLRVLKKWFFGAGRAVQKQYSKNKEVKMKAVIQRVGGATLSVDGELISQIGKGLVVYFCVEKGDSEKLCGTFANKLVKLRIFEDGNGKMNLSVKDVQGEVLFVSQFTLAADLSAGNRPSFINAENPQRADELYRNTARLIADLGVPTKIGVFGADMTIQQQNRGPVTIIWEGK